MEENNQAGGLYKMNESKCPLLQVKREPQQSK
jgi:hypothetical protein